MFLELIFQWRESLKTRKDKPHKALCLPRVNFSVSELYIRKVKKEKTSALTGLRVHLRTVDPHSSLVYAVMPLADVHPWAQKPISWRFCGRVWVCTEQWDMWLTWRACPAEGEPSDTAFPVQLLLWAGSLFAVCLVQCPCIFVLFCWWLSCLLWSSRVMLWRFLGSWSQEGRDGSGRQYKVVSSRHEPQCYCPEFSVHASSVCYMQHVSTGNINQGYILIGWWKCCDQKPVGT